MKISEIITDKYKLRIPPTVYYDLLADVQELEEQESYRGIEDYENEIEDLHNRLDIAEYDKERLREEVTKLEEKIKALEKEPRKITLEDVKGYCKPRLLTLITNELYHELIHHKINPIEQEPCDKCEVGNPCLYCKHEFEPKESEEV